MALRLSFCLGHTESVTPLTSCVGGGTGSPQAQAGHEGHDQNGFALTSINILYTCQVPRPSDAPHQGRHSDMGATK